MAWTKYPEIHSLSGEGEQGRRNTREGGGKRRGREKGRGIYIHAMSGFVYELKYGKNSCCGVSYSG